MSTLARKLLLWVLPLSACLLPIARTRGEEPAARQESPAKPEPVLRVPAAAEPVPCPCYRRSRYDIWQNYGVDRSGYFRLRVNYNSGGSYYLFDGRPFPWVTTHELEIMPWVVD
jgi:hypothetical protein